MGICAGCGKRMKTEGELFAGQRYHTECWHKALRKKIPLAESNYTPKKYKKKDK